MIKDLIKTWLAELDLKRATNADLEERFSHLVVIVPWTCELPDGSFEMIFDEKKLRDTSSEVELP